MVGLITSCKRLLKIRKGVDSLMATCENYSRQLGKIVNYLTKSTTLEDDPEHSYITAQPESLNKR